MRIAVQCPRCGTAAKVRDDLAGRRVKCRVCGSILRLSDPSGIIRHTERSRKHAPAFGDCGAIEAISDHIEKHIGPIHMVWNEIVSDLVHVDVHQVSPSEHEPYHTLVSSGMSDKPMQTPDELGDWRYAELVLRLPASWPISQEAFADERNYWPVRCLKSLARFPHECHTWLGHGHTVPNGDPPEPYASNTELCCALLMCPYFLAPEFFELELGPEKTIHFYSLIPIYPEELDFKLKRDTESLQKRFERHDLTDVLDINRVNVCKKSR